MFVQFGRYLLDEGRAHLITRRGAAGRIHSHPGPWTSGFSPVNETVVSVKFVLTFVLLISKSKESQDEKLNQSPTSNSQEQFIKRQNKSRPADQ